MFRCFVTGKLSAENEKPYKVVVEKRERTYISDTDPDKIAAVGWEISREVLMTKEGYEIWLKNNS